MKDKKLQSIKNTRIEAISLIASMLMLCLIFIGGGIFLSYVSHKHKQQSIDIQFSANKIANTSQITIKYKSFWDAYDAILLERANEDGNPIISVEEKKVFDDGFFGTLGLTVDATTKIITKLDGSYPNEIALKCRITSYYPDQPWVHPICPDL